MSVSQESVDIHPSAVVSPSAEIGAGTSIGAFSLIGPKVKLGKNNRIGSHVVLDGNTELGDDNKIFQFASVGAEPQDLKYHGEDSKLVIGSKNTIREYVTIQPGTEGGGMETRLGDQNLFMVCAHVGHDVIIGSHNIIANSVALAGHVIIEDNVLIGGLVGIHQFVRIGEHAMLAAGAMVNYDIPPFCIAHGDRAGLVGIHQIGPIRKGIPKNEMQELKKLYREIFFEKQGVLKDRVEEAISKLEPSSRSYRFLDFIRNSERGIAACRQDAD